MWATRCDANKRIASRNGCAVDNLGTLNGTNTEAGQIVFTDRVHVGHLGGFATDQRGTCQGAAFCNTGDDVSGRIDLQLSAGEVIEEEEGFSPLHEYIVDAHCHEVDANGRMAVQRLGQHQFGTNAVGPRNQHRLPVATRIQRKQAAEAAKP